jgi:hypothetical protein
MGIRGMREGEEGETINRCDCPSPACPSLPSGPAREEGLYAAGERGPLREKEGGGGEKGLIFFLARGREERLTKPLPTGRYFLTLQRDKRRVK